MGRYCIGTQTIETKIYILPQVQYQYMAQLDTMSISFCQHMRCLAQQVGEWNPICFNARTVLARIFAWGKKNGSSSVAMWVSPWKFLSCSVSLVLLNSTFPLLLPMQKFWQSAVLNTYRTYGYPYLNTTLFPRATAVSSFTVPDSLRSACPKLPKPP